MPEDIKKETIDNETAENKAEEIEIEGADEESTQTAEETKDAKDTDVNETESDDDALADAEAKADDILALYRLLIANKSTSTWRNERKTFEIDENNNLITRTNDFFRVGSSVQKQSWGKVLKLITKLFKDDMSFSYLLQKLEDEEVLLWKLYFYSGNLKMMITEQSKEGETMYAGVSNKDFVKLLNKEGIIFRRKTMKKAISMMLATAIGSYLSGRLRQRSIFQRSSIQ